MIYTTQRLLHMYRLSCHVNRDLIFPLPLEVPVRTLYAVIQGTMHRVAVTSGSVWAENGGATYPGFDSCCWLTPRGKPPLQLEPRFCQDTHLFVLRG